MEIHFTVTEDDYIKYNLFHHKNSPSGKRGVLITRLIFPVVLVLVTLVFSHGRFEPGVWIVPLILAMAWFLGYPRLYRNSLAKNVRNLLKEGRENGFIGRFTLILKDDVMRHETDGRMWEMAYRFVERIARDYERIYIYTGSVTAIIIPVSTFEDEAAMEAFLAEVRRRTILKADVNDF